MSKDYEDRYLQLENLNKTTMDFAAAETEKFRNAFRNESERIRKEIRQFSDVVNVMQVKINGRHKALLFKEKDSYCISVDGSEVVRSDKIITWFSTNESFSMLSYFETEGSDLGYLYILDSGKILEKVHGFFGGVKFFGNRYYILKSFRGEDQAEGVEKNAERVILDGKIVWGGRDWQHGIYRHRCLREKVSCFSRKLDENNYLRWADRRYIHLGKTVLL